MRALYNFDHVPPHAFDMSNQYNIVGIFGCVFWALAYVFAIRANWKDKTYSLPASAICLNIGWEFLTSFVFPDPVPTWKVLEIGWFLLDCVIVVQLFWYGGARQIVPELRRYWPGVLVTGILFGAAAQYTFVAQYRDSLGFVAGFLINSVMSVNFVFFYFLRRDSGSGVSKAIAWCKMLGTVGTGYEAFFLMREIDPSLRSIQFFEFLWFTIFAFDSLYVWMLYRPVPQPAPSPAVAVA